MNNEQYEKIITHAKKTALRGNCSDEQKALLRAVNRIEYLEFLIDELHDQMKYDEAIKCQFKEIDSRLTNIENLVNPTACK